MLRIDKVQTIEGVTVYGDDKRQNKFYVVAEQPRFRLDPGNGSPVFRFLKYRTPIDRAGGAKAGGFVFFDVEFSVPDETMVTIKSELQSQIDARRSRGGRSPKVEIGSITYTKGTAALHLKKGDGTFIEDISSPASPSLYGRNITPFAIELSQDGAALFWEAMQGRGGIVQVVYNLTFQTALPPVRIWGQFRSEAFYSFFQEIDMDWNVWGEDSYTETIREKVRNSDSMVFRNDFGRLTGPEGEKLKNKLRDWAFRTLEDAAERRMLEAIGQVPEEGRKRPDNVENVTRDFETHKVATFTLDFKENQCVDWLINPGGTLPNITNLKDKSGSPVKWSDHASEIDLNDKFFMSQNVSISVNADFEKLPIHSVKAHLEYKEGSEHQVKDYSFSSPDDVHKFATYIANDKRAYKYWYEVNYTGESKTFKSPEITTDEQILTLNIGDLGVMSVDLVPGDLNFEQVQRAQVTLVYEDSGVPRIEEQFTLDKDNTSHTFQHVIFKAQEHPYTYKVRYFMSDGKEFESAWTDSRLTQLPINDPFAAIKTINLRSVGNLAERIQTIFLDVEYVDETNDYRQNKSIALSKDQPFFDWDFPVIDEGSGKIVYSGTIQFFDGTSETIEPTETTTPTIMVGEAIADFLEVEVLPQLIPWDTVQLAQVKLRYEDADNNVKEADDYTFVSSPELASKKWIVELADKSRTTYTWSAVFFMNDNTQRVIESQESDSPSIVLQLPAA